MEQVIGFDEQEQVKVLTREDLLKVKVFNCHRFFRGELFLKKGIIFKYFVKS